MSSNALRKSLLTIAALHLPDIGKITQTGLASLMKLDRAHL